MVRSKIESNDALGAQGGRRARRAVVGADSAQLRPREVESVDASATGRQTGARRAVAGAQSAGFAVSVEIVPVGTD